ncbi:MAG: zinc ABC transporter substrate-binding protein [Erysipelotrichaceae bacterium]|nr:zinc ABC transporter substrate-binding protein [Erysipelotrichaceae bacterium]
MKKIGILLLTIFLCSVMLTGCSSHKLHVCYTVYPIEYILDRIAENRITKTKLSTEDPIQVAHIISNYKDEIESADLVLQMGELEPYWGIYSSEIAQSDATIIDLTTMAAIYDFKRYTKGIVSGNSVIVESDYYDGTTFQSIDVYSKDPNLWLDPIAMSSMSRTIKDWLVANYPQEAGFFESNFKALEADLVRLDAEFRELDTTDMKIVTVTPSFGNWQKAYGIEVYPLILSRYGALPTDEQLEIIKQRIKDDNVKYIAKEANMTEEMLALYEEVKKDCNLKEIALSNISTITEAEFNKNKDYLTIMYDNLTALEKIR